MSRHHYSQTFKRLLVVCKLAMLIIVIGSFLVSCTTDPPVPKPRTYPRLELPERNSQIVSPADCPFEFTFPDYASVKKGKTFFNEEPPHPCWFDLAIPELNANIFMSYHEISDRKDFERLVRDAYKINTQINKRSDYMEEIPVRNKAGIVGMAFVFEGAAASPMHFYLSDTTSHFLKGALYYGNQVRPDSLAPATVFIKEDINRLLGSFRWK